MNYNKEGANIFCEYSSLCKISKSAFNKVKMSYENNEKIPYALYNQYEESLRSVSYMWKEAKRNSDFNVVRPYLEDFVTINKELIQLSGDTENKYDTLLRLHNIGINSAVIDEIFYELKDNIITLFDRIRVNEKQVEDYSFINKITNTYKEEVNNIVFQNFGKYFNYDTYTDNFLLYNIEINLMRRVKVFWKTVYLKFIKCFDEFRDIPFNYFYKQINIIRSSVLIKNSDELTYMLHLIIRYEIEKKLINDEIKVEDLPTCWMCKYKEYMNVTPNNDLEGILQENRWFEGNFGSFPTDVLNNIYILQILNKLEADLVCLHDDIEQGNLKPMQKWVEENINQYSNSEDSREFIKKVTKEEPNAKYLINYLNKKYTDLYNL